MSTTTWVILQIWLTGVVGGLLWLLVAWTGKKLERLMLRRRNHPPARPMAGEGGRDSAAAAQLAGPRRNTVM